MGVCGKFGGWVEPEPREEDGKTRIRKEIILRQVNHYTSFIVSWFLWNNGKFVPQERHSEI